jgi:hypothetical protein
MKQKSTSDFIVKKRFDLRLPELVDTPKLLRIQSNVKRHVPYRHSEFSRKSVYPIVVRHSLSMPLSLPALKVFHKAAGMESVHPESKLDVVDQELLRASGHATGNPSSHTPQPASGLTANRTHISWLKRTEYMDTGPSPLVSRKIPLTVEQEEMQAVDCSWDAQIELIEESFVKANTFQIGGEHPYRRGVTALRVVPLVPHHDEAGGLVLCRFVNDGNDMPSEELDVLKVDVDRKTAVTFTQDLEAYVPKDAFTVHYTTPANLIATSEEDDVAYYHTIDKTWEMRHRKSSVKPSERIVTM